ncbi:MAG: outer membrane protein assembly factor BamB family protein [Gaiellaceae bacterium]
MLKRVLIGVGIVVLLAAGAVAAFVIIRLNESRDIHPKSTVEFNTRQAPLPPPPPRPAGISWPTFGYGGTRTHVGPGQLRPPFRISWSFSAGSLIEFPPVIGYGNLYFANAVGTLFALDASTGKLVWKRPAGRCTAASPAISEGVVFMTYLNRPPCNARGGRLDGEVVAFAARHGRVLWRRRIGPSESSPLVVGRRLYVGDWNGKVWALDRRDGHVLWSFQAGGAIKGAIAVTGRRLYAGSYDHYLYALDALKGRMIWRSGSQQRLGNPGTFYSTPALAYGRVYIGSTDGKMYSYGATSGRLIWSQSTGGYVYSSPAVWNDRVFAGSYGHDFYAFDAATGRVLWRFTANGRISGSPTVIDGVVYFATLDRRSYALEARSGRLLWSFRDGKYAPVVSDGKRIYLVGVGRVYGMVPR